MDKLSFKKISPTVETQLPEFVRVDHPAFVSFLEAYFEWIESDYSSFSILDLKHVKDVDVSLNDFVSYFSREYLVNFPENLAYDSETGPLSKETLIKNIRDFYRNKGTEKSYNLLFHILFNVDVDVYLPKTDILKVSGGNWITQKSIRTTVNLGSNIFKAKNKKIEQVDTTTGAVKAYGRCERVIVFRVGNLEVAELFLSNFQGTFETSLAIRFPNDDGKDFYESHTYEVLSGINIVNPGLGHVVGERIGISGGNGSGAVAEVARTDSNGGILRVRMLDFGVGYNDPNSIELSFTQTTEEIDGATSATGTITTGALCQYYGYYANEDGKLSSRKVMQDNRYYQNFSYVLKSEIVINRYRDAIKNLIHPAGFAFFGAVSIKRCAEAEMSNTPSLLQYEVPLVGQYTPYTLDETEDLSLVYPDGYYSPIAGTTLATPGNPRSDPFWIIFSHPNTRGMDTIPVGSSFGVVTLTDFFHMPGQFAGFSCGTFRESYI